MKILLDTCTFLWLAGDDPLLSENARGLFRASENEVFLSVVSAWEISVKHAMGRLPLPDAPGAFVTQQREALGVRSLPLDEESVFHAARLPELHRDPFDRMLVSQAIVHGLTILTHDPLVRCYPARTLW